MAQLSEATQRLIAKYNLWQQSQKPKEGVSTIHVDEVASKVAAFYEQIRTIVDWKEEHLMRRSAIIRKLKRRFLNLELSNFSGEEEIADILINTVPIGLRRHRLTQCTIQGAGNTGVEPIELGTLALLFTNGSVMRLDKKAQHGIF